MLQRHIALRRYHQTAMIVMANTNHDPEFHDASATKNLSSYSTDQIRQTLRSVVQLAFQADEADLLTYRRIRTATEERLNLAKGSLKEHFTWAKKSKQIIDDALTAEEHSKDNQSDDESPLTDRSAEEIPRKVLKRKYKDFSDEDIEEPSSSRKSMNTRKAPQKGPHSRSSHSSNVNEDLLSMDAHEKCNKMASLQRESEISGSKGESGKVTAGKTSKGLIDRQSSSVLLNLHDGNAGGFGTISAPMQAEAHSLKTKVSADEEPLEASESELSEVIDEAPPLTRRKFAKKQSTKVDRRSRASQAKTKQGARNGKGKVEDKSNPEEAEIKRLKSWLVKCGIRKVWFKELAPYDTTRAKVQHLKELLKNAGMEGRFSAEKASRIREQRELQADLEAVQEGAKMWGQTESDKSAEAESPIKGKRLARGLRNLDFLGSDEGEETD